MTIPKNDLIMVDQLAEQNRLSAQKDVIEFLSCPGAFELSEGQVDVIETHAAMIFLCGRKAYKLKKSLRYPYLDFSTLDKRKRVIEREFELNAPNAPQIYSGVTPVCRSCDGTLSVGGDGVAVEWLLSMQRFSQDALLSHQIEGSSLKPELIAEVSDAIIMHHRRAEVANVASGADRIKEIVVELDEAFRSARSVLKQNQVEEFCRRAKQHFICIEDCLRKRGLRGYVRRCHGDLHMENIVVLENKPVLFDALEFSERFATIDVLYDLAFLIMDLEAHGLRREANQTLNRYIFGDTGNLSGLQAMPLFLGCRAGIRAMVAISRYEQASTARSKEAAKAELEKYFELALRYLKTTPPALICIGGLSGTGKTSVSREIAPKLNNAPVALHLRSDIERKLFFGVSETYRLEERCYTKQVTEVIYRRLLRKAQIALLAGNSVIVDAVFLSEHERKQFERIAKKINVAFHGLWLEANNKAMMSRVDARTNDASDADINVVRKQLSQSSGPVQWQRIDAVRTLDDTVKKCLAVLV
ncbi:MAG: AAA family ATPase [Hyphomicrobiales bacterium]